MDLVHIQEWMVLGEEEDAQHFMFWSQTVDACFVKNVSLRYSVLNAKILNNHEASVAKKPKEVDRKKGKGENEALKACS